MYFAFHSILIKGPDENALTVEYAWSSSYKNLKITTKIYRFTFGI